MNAITLMPENNSIPYELILKPLLEYPKVNELGFNFKEGKVGRELYMDSPFLSTPSLKTACGWDFKRGSGIVKKALNPYELDFSFEQCYTVFLKSVFGDSLPNGWKKGELTPEIIDIIVSKQSNSFNYNLLMALFFADTASSTTWLSGGDGIFKKLADGIAANDGTVDFGAITDADISLANIESTLNAIYNAQAEYLMMQPDASKVLIVTHSIYKAWQRFVQVGGSSAGIAYTSATALVNGVGAINYNGIKMVDASYLDQGLKLYGNAGTSASTNLHRAILTVPTNHTIVMDGAGFLDIEPYYNRDLDVVRSPASAMIDYQYAFGDLNVVAGI